MDELGLLRGTKLILSSPKPVPVLGGVGLFLSGNKSFISTCFFVGRGEGCELGLPCGCMLLFANILSNPTIFEPVIGTLIVGRCVGEYFGFSSGKNISKLKDDAGRGGGLKVVGLPVACDCLTVGRCVGGRFEFSSGKKKSNVKDDEPFDDFISVGGLVGDSVGLRLIFTEGPCVGLRDNGTEGFNVGLKVVGRFEGE